MTEPRQPMRTIPTGSRAMAALIILVGVVLLFQWLGRGGSEPSVVGSAGTSATPSKTASAQQTDPASGLRWVDLSSLPAEAADTMAEIEAGPPFPYPGKDDAVYHNLNRVLPTKADGYYHEFTVPTPGSSTRGARRIVTGGPNRGQTNQEWYYTGDHYDTFVRIRP